jgi:hypothetical protein
MNEYTLNWSNNLIKPPFVINPREQIDGVCSLTLYGKGAPQYGEGLQENLIRMLEHFCSDTPPPTPTRGQTWYDVTQDALKAYNGNTWQHVASSASLATQNAGDNSSAIATTEFVQTAIGGRLVKAIDGSAYRSLTIEEAGHAIIEFTGTITANIVVLIPASAARSWIVKNSTTGGNFTVTVKVTIPGNGVTVTRGKTAILSSNGVDVGYADTDLLSRILLVDGAGSGLDADLLDGQQGSFYAPVSSPELQGTPKTPTAPEDTSTMQIASTAFVLRQAATNVPTMDDGTGAVGSSKKYARSDHVHPSDTSKAPIASPTFTGIPVAPTAAVNTNTTQLATTAFVLGQGATVAPPMNGGTAAAGTSNAFARSDHVHPSDTSKAPIASPTFTGIPAAPTAAPGTNTTQIATTEFVTSAVAAGGGGSGGSGGGEINFEIDPLKIKMDGTAFVGVASTVPRADHVHPSDTTRAAIESPVFTGIPRAPTAAPGIFTQQLATTEFVKQNSWTSAGAVQVATMSFTINATHMGKVIAVNVAGAVITLPAASLFPEGTGFVIRANEKCSINGTIHGLYKGFNPSLAQGATMLVQQYDNSWQVVLNSLREDYAELGPTSGFLKLQGGAWIQWGNTTQNLTANVQSSFIAFPYAFPSYINSINVQNNNGYNLALTHITTAGFACTQNGSSLTMIGWIAFGW